MSKHALLGVFFLFFFLVLISPYATQLLVILHLHTTMLFPVALVVNIDTQPVGINVWNTRFSIFFRKIVDGQAALLSTNFLILKF